MTDLTPVSSFDNVVEHPTTELLLAGAGGPLNQQAQSLLNRTEFLNDALNGQASQISTLETFDSDIGNSADLSKGANLVGRAVRNIDSIDELKLLTGRFNGETVTVSSFYSGWEALVPPVPEGGGLFVWNATSTATEVTGHIVKATATTTGRWFRVLNGDGIYEVTWSGVRSGAGFESTNTTLLNELIAYVDNGSKLHFPSGLVRINATLTISKAISLIGQDKLRSGLFGVGFAQDVPLVDYVGTTGARIQDIEFRRFAFWSDNNLARGVTLTWVNKSSFEDIYFYQLYRGLSGSNSWGNNFKNVSTFSITLETMTWGAESNNLTFERVEARGQSGIRFTSGVAALALIGCDFEGITSQSGRALIFAPVTGQKARAISIQGCYFENIAGAAISCAGADANSVLGLTIEGCYIYGGFQDHFGSVAGNATNAIILTNVKGFNIQNNHFEDWETNAHFVNSTESNGVVRDNTINRVTNLSSAAFQSSIRVANNDGLGQADIVLNGSATYDPPSLVDGAGSTTTVTVTGALLGDFVESSFSLSTQGITITSNVTAANTVTVRFQNETGGTIDLASGTLRARVFRL